MSIHYAPAAATEQPATAPETPVSTPRGMMPVTPASSAPPSAAPAIDGLPQVPTGQRNNYIDVTLNYRDAALADDQSSTAATWSPLSTQDDHESLASVLERLASMRGPLAITDAIKPLAVDATTTAPPPAEAEDGEAADRDSQQPPDEDPQREAADAHTDAASDAAQANRATGRETFSAQLARAADLPRANVAQLIDALTVVTTSSTS